MNLTKKILFALGLLAASASYAQTAPASSSSNGLLGQRYVDVSLGVQDLKDFPDNFYAAGASVNLPAVPSLLDVGASYSYSWLRGTFRGHANTVGVYGTAYTLLGSAKPFLTAGVGYQWANTRFGSDSQGLWGLGAGIEIPAGAFTITPRVSYADDFEDGFESTQQWSYGAEGNYWFSPAKAFYVSVGYTDVARSPIEAWNYTAGFRFKF